MVIKYGTGNKNTITLYLKDVKKIGKSWITVFSEKLYCETDSQSFKSNFNLVLILLNKLYVVVEELPNAVKV